MSVRLGVVLGAGGEAGWDFHVGVLSALVDRAEVVLEDSETVVGTSAGALLGAYVTNGVPLADLVRPGGGIPVVDPDPDHGPWTPGTPGLVRDGAAGLRRGAGGLVRRLVPPGRRPTGGLADELRARTAGRWPATDLRIVTVDRGTGERVVLDRTTGSLLVAVRASVAVPGFYEAVEHEGRTLVDGGVHSMTNADLVDPGTVDVLVVSAPRGLAAGLRPRHPALLSRLFHQLTLERELRRAREAGLPTLVFAPSPTAVRQAGRDRRARVGRARAEALAHLDHESATPALERLRS